jgi:diadenosine tetraphosphate (Ap4A) HIT family hydrolase
MKHPTYDAGCRVCRFNAGEDPDGGETVFENDLWLLRQRGRGVPGWMVLQTQRHSPGIAYFNEAEAANLGLALRHFEKTLEAITGAKRIYTANLGEMSNHFHAHIVPLYDKMPLDAISWKVFELHRTPSVVPDAVEVARVSKAYRAAMIENPPPLEATAPRRTL